MTDMKRRQFIKRMVQAGAVVSASALSAQRVAGANDRVRGGLIGCGGRGMVAAARRHNRVVQMGTQQRSAPHYAEVARIIQSGALGPVHFVRIWNYTNMFPNGIGRALDSDPPEGVDWDMYLGPAPYVRFNKNRFINTYRWFWDYGGGLVTHFCIHRFDSLHPIIGVDAPGTGS